MTSLVSSSLISVVARQAGTHHVGAKVPFTVLPLRSQCQARPTRRCRLMNGSMELPSYRQCHMDSSARIKSHQRIRGDPHFRDSHVSVTTASNHGFGPMLVIQERSPWVCLCEGGQASQPWSFPN